MSRALESHHPKCPDTFLDTLTGTFGQAALDGNIVQWTNPAGIVRATVSALDAITFGGRRIVGAVTVIQQLRLLSEKQAAQIVARHNNQPGLGIAFQIKDEPGVVEVASRATFYQDEAGIREKLGLNLAIAAICNMTTSLDYGAGKKLAALPHHDEPSHWGTMEFAFLAWQMHRAGEEVCVDGSNLVARIKFDKDWWPGVEDNGDPRIALTSECVHTSLGRGLATEVSLCVDLTQEQAQQLVHSLNRQEADSVNGPPCLGAWAMDPTGRRLIFASFWPNLAHIPDYLGEIARWSRQRLELAKDALARTCAPRSEFGIPPYTNSPPDYVQ